MGEKIDKEKALVDTLTKMGINPYDEEIQLNYQQVLELRDSLKKEYGIDVVIKTDIDEMLSHETNDFAINEPHLSYCGTPPDGRERRRERRKLERLQKRKRLL